MAPCQIATGFGSRVGAGLADIRPSYGREWLSTMRREAGLLGTAARSRQRHFYPGHRGSKLVWGRVRTAPMSSERIIPTEPVPQPEDTLTQMPKPEFIAGWKALVGEPPAAMLEDRSEMIRVLVESTPVAPLEGVDEVVEGDQAIPAQSPRLSRT